MKLSRIPGHEATVKHSFAFKQSTTSLLLQYQELYAAHTGLEVSLKDVVEQMLLDFMTEDKAFQKLLKQRQESSSPASQPAGAASPSKPAQSWVDGAEPASLSAAPALGAGSLSAS